MWDMINIHVKKNWDDKITQLDNTLKLWEKRNLTFLAK